MTCAVVLHHITKSKIRRHSWSPLGWLKSFPQCFSSPEHPLWNAECKILLYFCPIYTPISGMPCTYNTWGLMEGRRGIDISWWNKPPYLRNKPVYSPLKNTPDLPVMHGEVWVFVEFKKNFQRPSTQRKVMCMPFVRIGTILTKYQPLREDSDSKSPSFFQHLPQVCKVGHTIDRHITSTCACLCQLVHCTMLN